ncbi:helix-turn-helix domain-containing protein [Paraburkholderia sp. MM5384-R2]|uniref:helix-turn-helix domain-containing protein n=1 Tax=Paraburkholderia sp. MM5384-R2 TaxID=2723097 RepID=UPI0017958A00|nr:helix-turn-helix domain-containing protein [Paraburkholderia sp. MM5384-R2]MBB5501132.1 AcrR family transcriptional regulator [Paraburkholderia sp. MM5384-R2]
MKHGKHGLIAQAAHRLFQQQGFTATKMAQIASAAGMTAANLYVYFDSKLAILYEVYRSLARHSRRRRELRQCALIEALARRHRRAVPSRAFLNEMEVAVGSVRHAPA